MSLNPLDPFLDALEQGRPSQAPPGVTFRYATVTSVSPLRVQFDGESSPTAASPTTIAPVISGDRVLVAHHGRTQMTILGKVGSKVPEPVAGHRYAVSNMSVPVSTVTTLGIFGSAGDDVSGGVVTVGNYGLRIPEAGWYSLSGMLRWLGSSSSTQLRIMDMTRDNILGNDLTYPADAGGVMSHVSVAAIRLAANTIIGLTAYTTAQRETNTAASFNMACHLSLAKIG